MKQVCKQYKMKQLSSLALDLDGTKGGRRKRAKVKGGIFGCGQGGRERGCGGGRDYGGREGEIPEARLLYYAV